MQQYNKRDYINYHLFNHRRLGVLAQFNPNCILDNCSYPPSLVFLFCWVFCFASPDGQAETQKEKKNQYQFVTSASLGGCDPWHVLVSEWRAALS